MSEYKIKQNKYYVYCTAIYNACEVVEAESMKDAMDKVLDLLDSEKEENQLQRDALIGDVAFSFGEATVDFAEEIPKEL